MKTRPVRPFPLPAEDPWRKLLRMKRFLLAAGLTVLVVSSAAAASLSRTYSYFTMGGTTL